jgi:hypothetical protein
MTLITLPAIINENHDLIVELPNDIPPGQVEITIRTISPTEAAGNAERDRIREKLRAAGHLAVVLGIPDDIEPANEEALEELGQLPLGAKSSEELIDEDRGQY